MATEYVILTGETPESDEFKVVDHVEAVTATQAIKNVAGKHGEGTYVAVPGRSFSPVTVQVESRPRVRLLKGGQEVEGEDGEEAQAS